MARDLNDTLIFAKVVEHGSFISAARALRLPKTTVSRKIQELEQRMYQHARDLEFEDAARLRDQIQRLKEASLGG